MLWRPADRNAPELPGDGGRPDYDLRLAQWAGVHAQEHSLQFRDLAGILRRRKWMILAIAVFGTIAAAALGLMVSPKYTATVQLVVEVQPDAPAAGRGLSPIDEAVDTHLTLIGSRRHLRRVAKSLVEDAKQKASAQETNAKAAGGWTTQFKSGLAAWMEEFRPQITAAEAAGGWLGEIARRLRNWMGPSSDEERALIATIEELESGVKVNQERRSRIISVAFTSKDRVRAAESANRIAELYVEDQLQTQRARTAAELARLEQRAAELKHEMEAAERSTNRGIGQRLQTPPDGSAEAARSDRQQRELERHAAAGLQQYRALMRRQKELTERMEAITPGIAVRSWALVPERPSSHNPILFVLPALILFAIGGSLLAVVLEQIDHGIRSEREINDLFGAPCIGLVPRVSRWRRGRVLRHLLGEPFSPYAEAIRSVYSALNFEPASRTGHVVLITSSVSGEGRTTLAASLAAYAARIGQRALLIDFDARHLSARPTARETRDTCIIDVLVNGCSLEGAIQRHPEGGFDHLPMTRCPIDPVELVARDELSDSLRRARKNYDCILIDGPPALEATETRLLAALSDRVVLAVKWGSTRRELVRNALTLLTGRRRVGRKRVERPTCVVTQADLTKHFRYRFGDAGEVLARSRPGRPAKAGTDRGYALPVNRKLPIEAEGSPT